MTKWSIELAEHDLTFKSRNAIKAQTLADFLAEGVSISTPKEEPEKLSLFVDGEASHEGCGAGLLMISPKGEEFSYALRFEFVATNNEAEYEALIAGLNLAIKLRAKKLIVHSDSQLIVNQVKGDYEAREEPVQIYQEKVKGLMKSFDEFELVQIPRVLNKKADALSKLGSTSTILTKKVQIEVIKN